MALVIVMVMMMLVVKNCVVTSAPVVFQPNLLKTVRPSRVIDTVTCTANDGEVQP
jgi:hypothetical protein